MDICDLIADDHEEQRRLFGLINQLGANDCDTLKSVWSRLRALLDTHADAEEKYFYPELLKIGRGADRETPVEETRDAIKDHNEIRDSAARVDKEESGSAKWFAAVAAANRANSGHMAEEERQGLADFREHVDVGLRHRIAVRFIGFESAHLTGVKPVDRNVDKYVLENS